MGEQRRSKRQKTTRVTDADKATLAQGFVDFDATIVDETNSGTHDTTATLCVEGNCVEGSSTDGHGHAEMSALKKILENHYASKLELILAISQEKKDCDLSRKASLLQVFNYT